jgi:ABC-2 family transporter protein
MTTFVFLRRFVDDYARNRVNLLFLIVVPVVFVVVAAGSMADAAKLLGGTGSVAAVQVVTAGWSAGFLAAVAMYFQVSSSRGTDQRLVISGLPAHRLVTARLLTGLVLAGLAAVAAVIALAARSQGLDDPERVIAGTLMFAIIYLAIGAAVGALVATPVNGIAMILLIWTVDVFFGPVLSVPNALGTRVLPTHFVSLWMTGTSSGHAGSMGDLGWALVWTLGAAAVAFAVVLATTRTGRARRRRRPGGMPHQLAATLRAGLRDWGRTRLLWVLLGAIPALLILMTRVITPASRERIVLTGDGRRLAEIVNLSTFHPANMAPIAVAMLATLAGMFVILDARAGDRRLALAGLRINRLVVGRLSLVLLAAMVATVVSLVFTAIVADVHQWIVYAVGIALIAVTYGLIGVVLAPIFGRVAGVFMAFLIPFLDIGLVQSPMLHPLLPVWAEFLPGYGGSRVLVDGAISPVFNQSGALLLGLGWLVILTIGAVLLCRSTQLAVRDGDHSR